MKFSSHPSIRWVSDSSPVLVQSSGCETEIKLLNPIPHSTHRVSLMSSSLFATAKIYTNVACVLGPEGPEEHQQQPWGRRDDTQAAAHEKPIKPNPHHIDSPHFIFSLSPSLFPNSTANENEEGWQKRRTTTRNNNKNTAAYQSRQHQLSSSSWNHLYYFNPHSIPSTLGSHSLCVMLPFPFHVENSLPPIQRHPHIANFPLECAAHICLFMV